MKQSNKMMLTAAEIFDLPADIVAGVPRMELMGKTGFSIEPHNGLAEYSEEIVKIDSAVGPVYVCGQELSIKIMNRERIEVCGTITKILVGEAP